MRIDFHGLLLPKNLRQKFSKWIGVRYRLNSLVMNLKLDPKKEVKQVDRNSLILGIQLQQINRKRFKLNSNEFWMKSKKDKTRKIRLRTTACHRVGRNLIDRE